MAWLHPSFLWALAAVPVAVVLLLWASRQRRAARARLGAAPLVARLAGSVSARRRRWKGALFVLGVAALALALAGPRFGTRLREAKRQGVDLVVALDVSRSMLAEDVAPNRLERAKNEIKKLLGALDGDRVALVLFAGDAFVQAPLTTDYNAVRLFLDVAAPDLMATPGTDFGAAVEAAVMAVERHEAPGGARPARALLIVSDGENHVANLESVQRRAREAGFTVYAAGVGEAAPVPIPRYEDGRRVGTKLDRAGRPIETRLEEEVLQRLAEGGLYFHVGRTASRLPQLGAALDRLEQTEYAADAFADYAERYQWPLALALLLLAVETLVSDRRRPSQPD